MKHQRIKYLRESLIHSFVLNQKGSKHDLLVKCNQLLSDYDLASIGLRTLEKQIKELKEKYRFPIESFIPSNEELQSKDYRGNIVNYPHGSIDVRKVRFLRYSKEFELRNEIRRDEREKIDEAFTILSKFIGWPGWEWLDDVLDESQNTLDLNALIDQRVSFEENFSGMKSFFLKIKDALGNKTVLRIKRIVFQGSKKMNHDLIFHPIFLKLWKNKWYTFGVGELEDKLIEPYVLPIDKYILKIEYPRGIKFKILEFNFKGEPIDTYFFKDIIGVTNLSDFKLEKIILRFHNKERFRRIDAKQPHMSWQIINEEDGFIDVKMNLKINPELRNFIHEHSPGIEVIKPKSLRERIIKDLKNTLENYTN